MKIGKKVYTRIIKTDNKEKLYTHIVLLSFGIGWIIYVLITLDYHLGILKSQYIDYGVDPLSTIILLTFFPLILIIIGFIGINDYYQRKKVIKNPNYR